MKILDLFNEYNLSPEMTGGEVEQPRTEKDRNTMSRIYKAYIVSKDFGWIKWLVDNDKIDFESENYPLKKYYPYFNDDILAIVSQDCNTYEDHCRVCYDKYESLLMLLAISDTPIDDLISYLK